MPMAKPIYIPFWLNLYALNRDIIVIIKRIYIPFWLNLYSLKNRRRYFYSAFTFHSG